MFRDDQKPKHPLLNNANSHNKKWPVFNRKHANQHNLIYYFEMTIQPVLVSNQTLYKVKMLICQSLTHSWNNAFTFCHSHSKKPIYSNATIFKREIQKGIKTERLITLQKDWKAERHKNRQTKFKQKDGKTYKEKDWI